MSVIKRHSGDAGNARRLMALDPASVARPSDPVADENAILRAEIATLADRLECAFADVARITDLAASEAAHVRDRGYAEGFDAGIAAAESQECDRLVALNIGIAAEAAHFRERLDALEGLAVALARAALAKVFARSDAMADMVALALQRHVAGLRDDAVLSVRVSGSDFSDPEAAEAAARAAGRRVAVIIDPSLPAGACRVAAQLGGIDLDVPAQWVALARLLDEMTIS